MNASCIYEGKVWHRRRDPIEHRFGYRLFMIYLDLDELSSRTLDRRLIGRRRFSVASFYREDHMGDPRTDLKESVSDFVEGQTGARPQGSIRLLTQLRMFGFYFSPLNLYFCFDEKDEQIETVVAEVNNTPWGEQHCYVLWSGNRCLEHETEKGLRRFRHPKSMHVSPFMQMEVDYDWSVGSPDERLVVSIANLSGDREIFSAGMQFKRRALTRSRLGYALSRYPWITLRIFIAVYWQALRLWWKKCPTYLHPRKHKHVESPMKPVRENP